MIEISPVLDKSFIQDASRKGDIDIGVGMIEHGDNSLYGRVIYDGQQFCGRADVGYAKPANAAVRPGLFDNPIHDLSGILYRVFWPGVRPCTEGGACTAHIDGNKGIAVAGKKRFEVFEENIEDLKEKLAKEQKAKYEAEAGA